MEQIQGYKLLGKIGEGGMATVYKGLQVSLNRPVAIKVLAKNLAEHGDLIERFKRESLIIARLTNPHIIHVIDRGITGEGMPYFIMEFVEGTDLAERIKEGVLDHNRKLDLVIQICKALAYAHKNGVIHRDLKPSNVLIDREGNARMLDFGIAQFYEDDESGSADRTRPGMLMGTMPYMSPEQQVSADAVTTLSDLYSLGVLMYELFAGKKPFGRYAEPRALDPTIPPVVEEVILHCMEVEPVNRPTSVDDIKERLLKVLRGAHIEATQRQRASQGITNVKDKFALLDVIKDEPHGAVYLYEKKEDNSLMVIKKRPSWSLGYTEAKLLGALDHDNIVKILGVSKNKQLFIIAMEYVSGGSLSDRMIKPYSWSDFLPIAKEVSQALAFAHKNRIVHGNLRPSNVLFTQAGHVKVTDFGLDRHYDKKKEEHNWYSVPGEGKSKRGDIFACGVMFYQMLTGTLPEWDEESKLVMYKQFRVLPFDVQQVITVMLARDLDARYRSFDLVAEEIDALLETAHEVGGYDDPTQYLEGEPSDKTVCAVQQPKATSRRALRFFLVVLLLAACAGASPLYKDDLAPYVEKLKQLWKTTLPYIDIYLQKIKDLLPQ